MNDPVDNKWGLEKLHNKILEAMVYLHAFCQQNDIRYSLAYGSVLGAIRHQGFIPWDDDMDIYMTADDYEKFSLLFKQFGDQQHYFLQEFNCCNGMVGYAKLRINNTTYIEPLLKNVDMHHGIYIDIFILHRASNNLFGRWKMYLAEQYLALKGLAARHYSRRKLFLPILAFLRLLPVDFLREIMLKVLSSYDGGEEKYFFDPDTRNYQKCFFEQSMIFPTKLWMFEGINLLIPNDADGYLHQMYGDYMQIPKIDEIEWHQHAVVWDTERNYTEYLKL